MDFYKCPVCGNIITLITGNANSIRCCGKEMEQLVANSVEASYEKHMPSYEKKEDNIKVRVGEMEHPMIDEHYIMFIAQVVDNNINIVRLRPKDKPETVFKYVKGAKIYEYCNLHGLWVKDVI